MYVYAYVYMYVHCDIVKTYWSASLLHSMASFVMRAQTPFIYFTNMLSHQQLWLPCYILSSEIRSS